MEETTTALVLDPDMPTGLQSCIKTPFGEEDVKFIYGIGNAYGNRLAKAGFGKAADVLAKFMDLNQNVDEFKAWLKATAKINANFQNKIADCISKKCEFLPAQCSSEPEPTTPEIEQGFQCPALDANSGIVQTVSQAYCGCRKKDSASMIFNGAKVVGYGPCTRRPPPLKQDSNLCALNALGWIKPMTTKMNNIYIQSDQLEAAFNAQGLAPVLEKCRQVFDKEAYAQIMGRQNPEITGTYDDLSASIEDFLACVGMDCPDFPAGFLTTQSCEGRC